MPVTSSDTDRLFSIGTTAPVLSDRQNRTTQAMSTSPYPSLFWEQSNNPLLVQAPELPSGTANHQKKATDIVRWAEECQRESCDFISQMEHGFFPGLSSLDTIKQAYGWGAISHTEAEPEWM
jgi:hypothetical protein